MKENTHYTFALSILKHYSKLIVAGYFSSFKTNVGGFIEAVRLKTVNGKIHELPRIYDNYCIYKSVFYEIT